MVTWIAFPQKESEKTPLLPPAPQLFRVTKTLNIDKIDVHLIAD